MHLLKKSIECPKFHGSGYVRRSDQIHHSRHRVIRQGITLFAHIVTLKESNKICQVFVELQFGKMAFAQGRKPEDPEKSPQRKAPGARTRTNNILNSHVTTGSGIEPG